MVQATKAVNDAVISKPKMLRQNPYAFLRRIVARKMRKNDSAARVDGRTSCREACRQPNAARAAKERRRVRIARSPVRGYEKS